MGRSGFASCDLSTSSCQAAGDAGGEGNEVAGCLGEGGYVLPFAFGSAFVVSSLMAVGPV